MYLCIYIYEHLDEDESSIDDETLNTSCVDNDDSDDLFSIASGCKYIYIYIHICIHLYTYQHMRVGIMDSIPTTAMTRPKSTPKGTSVTLYNHTLHIYPRLTLTNIHIHEPTRGDASDALLCPKH